MSTQDTSNELCKHDLDFHICIRCHREEIERLQLALKSTEEACDSWQAMWYQASTRAAVEPCALQRHKAGDLYANVDVYVMKPSEAAVFEKVSRQRRVITPVFELCNAYESGIGHGLQKDDAVNPYPPRTQNAEAYQIGYEEGARRASLPPSAARCPDCALKQLPP